MGGTLLPTTGNNTILVPPLDIEDRGPYVLLVPLSCILCPCILFRETSKTRPAGHLSLPVLVEIDSPKTLRSASRILNVEP